MTPAELETFQQRLGACGYVFQFVTLAGYHATNMATYLLAKEYRQKGMLAYSTLQESEFSNAHYTGSDHQTEAGVTYFDAVAQAIGGGSTLAMTDNTR
jgi:isocitrate lyase